MSRVYEMQARAESTNRTRERILAAVINLWTERLSVQISLADIADVAEVNVKTVLRHFGAKEALFEAAWARNIEGVRAERVAPVGDVAAAVGTIVRSYERRG